MLPPDTSVPHPDQQFIERLRTDDPAVWREIYDRNRAKVVNYLRRRNAPDEVATSIFHETLLELDRRKATMQLTCKLPVFLISVALNQLRAYWRSQKRNLEEPVDDAEQLDRYIVGDDDADAAELALLQQAFADDPLLGKPAHDPDELIQRALAMLSATCATLFRLRYWESLNDFQIAESVPMEYRLVRNQFYKCKEKLKQLIKGLRDQR